MAGDASGPVALITGGGRGMGGAIARELAANGYRLALMSPSESCEKLAAELGGVASRGAAEKAEDIQAIFDLTMKTYGRIDAVVNHTGHPPKGDLLDLGDEAWALGSDMMVLSLVRMARLVTPVMLKQGKAPSSTSRRSQPMNLPWHFQYPAPIARQPAPSPSFIRTAMRRTISG